MLSGQIDGAPVEQGLIAGMVRLLLAAGHDSTTSALGICLHYLAQNLEAQAQLRARIRPALLMQSRRSCVCGRR
jgi:cytochrome P450